MTKRIQFKNYTDPDTEHIFDIKIKIWFYFIFHYIKYARGKKLGTLLNSNLIYNWQTSSFFLWVLKIHRKSLDNSLVELIFRDFLVFFQWIFKIHWKFTERSLVEWNFCDFSVFFHWILKINWKFTNSVKINENFTRRVNFP